LKSGLKIFRATAWSNGTLQDFRRAFKRSPCLGFANFEFAIANSSIQGCSAQKVDAEISLKKMLADCQNKFFDVEVIDAGLNRFVRELSALGSPILTWQSPGPELLLDFAHVNVS
jgi:hypothetical protein